MSEHQDDGPKYVPKSDVEGAVDDAKPVENPLLAFTKGGTPTEGSERLYEQRFREAEQRRKQDDAQKRVASKPVEHGGGKLFSHRLTRHPDVPQAYLLLHYVNAAGAKVDPGECLADVWITDWDHPNDLTLGIVCPRCLRAGVKHAQDCQLRIKMSNRRWHLESGKGEPEFVFDDGYGPKRYKSAGVITESEPFTCSDCNWRGRIVNNQIRTE